MIVIGSYGKVRVLPVGCLDIGEDDKNGLGDS